MILLFILFAAFIVQEPISSNALLLEAYQSGVNVWAIHATFVAATLIDAVAGYALGSYLYRFRERSALLRYLARATHFFENKTAWSRRFALFFWGPMLFPYSALAAPWIGASFGEAVACLAFGDALIWYGSEWLVVLGVRTFVGDPLYALYGVLIVSGIASFGVRYFIQRREAAKENKNKIEE